MSHILLFQGDSITDAGRSRDPKNPWNLGHGYAQIAAGHLTAHYPEKKFTVYNRAISGQHAIDLYARWQPDTIDLHPDTLSLLIGINDCYFAKNDNLNPTAMIKKYAHVYHLMLDEVLEDNPNTNLILMEPFLLLRDSSDVEKEHYARMQDYLQPMQQILPEIAAEYKAVYVPLQEKFSGLYDPEDPAYWLWDGVHPTPAGHEIVVREWLKAFESLHIL